MSEETNQELDLSNSVAVTLDSKGAVKPTVKLRFTNPADAELYADAVVTISKLILAFWTNKEGLGLTQLEMYWSVLRMRLPIQEKGGIGDCD